MSLDLNIPPEARPNASISMANVEVQTDFEIHTNFRLDAFY